MDDRYIKETEFNELYEDLDKIGKKIALFIRYRNGSQAKGLKFKNWEPNNDKL